MLGFVGALTVGVIRHVGAWVIAKAPNHEGVPAEQDPVPEDVSAVLQAEVGRPVAVLDVWILEPQDPVGTTLVLHGIHGDKASMVGVARSLRDRGQRAVLVDLRGHGASSGRWLSYGVRESTDLSQLLDQLEALGLLAGEVGIYGPSYGGAVALQTAALDPRIARVVSVSTFASLRSVVPSYAQRAVPLLTGLLPTAILDALADGALEDAGELGGFSPAAADPTSAIRRTRAQVLLIHGEADENIPVHHARTLRGACRAGACELLTIPGADHAGALQAPATLSRALDFLASGCLAPATASHVPWTRAPRF